jgi:hypothetical protein
MMRWNATLVDQCFVHVASALLTTPYTMSVTQPPQYHWRTCASNYTGDAATTTRLTLVDGYSAVVPMPFSFPFYGKSFRQLWVSAAGYVSFDAPQPGGFRGPDSISNAILAAGAVFDMSHPGTSVVYSQPNATSFQVQWQGPLYAGSELSSVSATLSAGGQIDVQWDRLELPSRGSLDHLLKAYYTFEGFDTPVANGASAQDTSGEGIDATLALNTAPPCAPGAPEAGECTFGDVMVVDIAAGQSDTVLRAFSGAEAGLGLDLDGDFVYAVNIGGDPSDGTIAIRDATFTPDGYRGSLTGGEMNELTPVQTLTPGVAVYAHGSHGYSDLRASERYPSDRFFGEGEQDPELQRLLDSQRYDWRCVTISYLTSFIRCVVAALQLT